MKKFFGIFVLVSIALVLISCGGGGGGGGGGAVAPAGTGTGTTTGTGSDTGASSAIGFDPGGCIGFGGRFYIDDNVYSGFAFYQDGTAKFHNFPGTLVGTYSFLSDELCTLTFPSGTVNLSISDSGYIIFLSNGTLTASGLGNYQITEWGSEDYDNIKYFESIENVNNRDELGQAIQDHAKNDIRSYCKFFTGVGNGYNEIGYDDSNGFIVCNGILTERYGNTKEEMLSRLVIPNYHDVLNFNGTWNYYNASFKYIPGGDAAHGEGFYITIERGNTFYDSNDYIFAGIYNDGNLDLYRIQNSMIIPTPGSIYSDIDVPTEQLLNMFDANTFASLRSDILSAVVPDVLDNRYYDSNRRIRFDHYADYGTSFNHSWICDYNYIFRLME
ncbi:MAG: hypothetical protein IKK38_09880 [Spirochaetaceae bacterium]|nr:hypothetical protein [Spirochaetaceae bacterium]